MKQVILVLSIVYAFPALSNGNFLQLLVKKDLYFSAYELLMSTNNPSILVKNKKILEKISRNIHPISLVNDRRLLSLHHTPTPLDFHIAVYFLERGQVSEAREILGRIHKKEHFYAQANFMLGTMALKSKQYKEAIQSFKRCALTSNKLEEDILHMGLRNMCIQYLSRTLFTTKQYKKALAYLNFIKKKDVIWPRVLLDQAWNYYWLKQYGRSLGKIVTYNSPILNRFYNPEVDYMRTLVYYKLCRYEKALDAYDEFVNSTNYQLKSLYEFLKEKNLKKLYASNPERNFAHKFFKGKKKEFKFSYANIYKEKLLIESKTIVKYLKAMKGRKTKLAGKFKSYYKQIHKKVSELDDYLLKAHVKSVKEYVQEINFFKKNIVKLKLLLGHKKRYLSRKNKGKKNFKSNQLSLYEIDGSDDKAIYEFIGGFWADELGDYAFALKPSCKGVK